MAKMNWDKVRRERHGVEPYKKEENLRILGFIVIKSKINSKCKCGNKIRKGKRIYWNPEEKIARCYSCGPKI